MRGLFWLILAIPPTVGCTGEGKSELEKLNEECLSACSNLLQYIERCDFELGASSEGYCETLCSEQNDLAAKAGCEDEFATFLDCAGSLDWGSVECTEDAMLVNGVACADKIAVWLTCVDDDTGVAVSDIPDPDTDEDCTHHLRVNGTPISEMESPRVGTSWFVTLWCDNIVESGPSVLQITPPHLASLDHSDPILTFVAAGNGTISMQVGTNYAEEPVTIQD